MSEAEQGGTAGAGGSGNPPHPIYNWLSFVGIVITASSLTAVVFFALIGALKSGASGYGGLTLLPPLAGVLIGLCLVLAGWLRERWRQKHGRHSSFLEKRLLDPLGFVRGAGPVLVGAGLVGATLVLLTAGAGSLAVVEYSESNEFCGQTCHAVMSPEATVYESSPHARIACVDCHIGEGGESFLRAKIGGMRQLWAVATGDISRPIHTPIRNRLPSSQMCESCHERDRFIGYKAITRRYHLSGEEGKPESLLMMVKVGGGNANGPIRGAGIHYHMLTGHRVEYIARDAKRQEIAWVKVTDPDGSAREYANPDKPVTAEERASLEVRAMECVDCHSRPAHRFASPVQSVEAALASQALSAKLPRIKEAAVRALDGSYETTPAAMAGIAESLLGFYEEESPEVLETGRDEIEKSSEALREIYRRTIFPEMKANWSAHPDNIGHRDSPGCFRCHNDELVDADGEAIFTDCTRCHAILAQGSEAIETGAAIEDGRDFVHPEDSEIFEEFTLCNDCHTGGAEVYE
jgi:NapC/NirT cytochrome c family, N-terminal region